MLDHSTLMLNCVTVAQRRPTEIILLVNVKPNDLTYHAAGSEQDWGSSNPVNGIASPFYFFGCAQNITYPRS